MVDARQLPDFKEPQLAMAIEALPSETVDALPYGAIRIGNNGKVEYIVRQSGACRVPAITTASASTSSAGSRPVWTIPTFAAASSVPGYRECSIWSSATSATSRTATGNWVRSLNFSVSLSRSIHAVL